MVLNSRNEDTLVFTLVAHIDPRTFCNSKYMGRVLIAALASILLDYSVGVKW